MDLSTQVAIAVLSFLLLGGLLAVSRGSSGSMAADARLRVYRVHPVWYVFCALGGAFLVGLLIFIAVTADAGNRAGPAWFAGGAAVFFIFFAYMMRSISATIGDGRLTVRTLGRIHTVALRDVDQVKTTGLAVEVSLKAPAQGKRPTPIVFLAVLRGLGDLLAEIRAGAGEKPSA